MSKSLGDACLCVIGVGVGVLLEGWYYVDAAFALKSEFAKEISSGNNHFTQLNITRGDVSFV